MAETIWSYLSTFGLLFWLDFLLALFVIFQEKKQPAVTILWVMVIMSFPALGFILFLLIGIDLSKTRTFKEKDISFGRIYPQEIERIEAINRGTYNFHDIKAYDYRSLIKLLSNNSLSRYNEHNKVDVFYNGLALKDDLIREIKQAQRSIYLQAYIIKSGAYFDELKEALIEKAQEGLDVRILVDGMGGRDLSKKDRKILQANGIKLAVFFPPFLGNLNIRMNFRNHRKVIVIDSKLGYVGGFNIGDEYIDKSKKFGHWRDTHLKIRGEAVNDLTHRFYLDYKFATGDSSGSYQSYNYEGEENYDVAMNIISSGPDHELEQIRDGFCKMIESAQSRIYLQTPYFIPDEGLFKSLRMAAYSGVDVKIMVPKKPDHPFVKSASRSYLAELMKYGAEVYYYETHGFLHSKMMLIDNFVSTVGTANFDIRSFSLNFEVNAFMYDYGINADLARQFHIDMNNSEKYTLKKYGKRKLGEKMAESISRLLSPVL
ncbi:MAG: cardiolipin synthase [Bacillota bacterium]|nr:cardiolipin synthase [Bacillota bacterium]